jgi:hypothetical protein
MTGIFHDFLGTYQDYCMFQCIAVLSQMKPWNCHHKSDPACTDALLGGGHHTIPSKAYFTEQSHMTGIYQVYACHIFQLDASESASAARRFRACWVSQARRNVTDLDFLATNSRLGPAKVPQPGVDLIDMAAPEWFLACAVGTPEFEGLLLSRSVLVWKGRGGVAMKKARKEWHQVAHRQR